MIQLTRAMLVAMASIFVLCDGADAQTVGTITIAIWRTDVVVLGADRRWTTFRTDGDLSRSPRRSNPKIVTHERLPLAVATAGLATLASRETAEFVKDAIAKMKFAKDLTRNRVSDEIIAALERPVRKERDGIRAALTGHSSTKTEAALKLARLSVEIGFVAGGKAHLIVILIDDRATVELPATADLKAWRASRTFIRPDGMQQRKGSLVVGN